MDTYRRFREVEVSLKKALERELVPIFTKNKNGNYYCNWIIIHVFDCSETPTESKLLKEAIDIILSRLDQYFGIHWSDTSQKQTGFTFLENSREGWNIWLKLKPKTLWKYAKMYIELIFPNILRAFTEISMTPNPLTDFESQKDIMVQLPILLDKTQITDLDIKKDIQKYNKRLNNMITHVIGTTREKFDSGTYIDNS